MTLISERLKLGVGSLLKKLTNNEGPSASLAPTVAVTRLTGPQTSEAVWPKFSVISDEPESVDGKDSAPPPSAIFVASIGLAENVVFARQAALQNVEISSCENRVAALWDRKGLFDIDNISPAITNVLIETKITTTAPPEKIAELVRLTHRRCPMTATIAKAAIIERKLFVNGLETPV